ncbi:MAG: glutamate--cysteine ligase [Caulobacteraceae bacterium]|nr:glutamate--cysteine ligase [Caulobacteraceae bacterium]
MAETATHDRPLTKVDLVEYLESGCKPPEQWRIGAEHEKFIFRHATNERVPYEGPDGVRAILKGMERFGWTPEFEGENPIALSRNGAAISLEPGGQFELSGAALSDVHQICDETGRHLAEVKEVADELGVGFLGLGFDPLWRRDQIPIMPKGRYDIMRAYMPKVGSLGLDMMLRTCTIQSNLDFSSEADMVAKFRTSLALQPIATALFANSPFTEGKPNGFLSSRANVWTDTDPDRTGLLDFVFEDGFGFERYVDYALDVPMYFAKREGRYLDLSGRSFRKFMDGKLDELPGEKPSIKDWADHTTTIFPEVRLKKYLEMRGADGGPWSRICALQALWAGILYDADALAGAWDLCKHWTLEDRAQLRSDVAKTGLKGIVGGRPIQQVAEELLDITRHGLRRRQRFSGGMVDETGYLSELEEIAESGVTPAERLLSLYHGRWSGDLTKVYEEFAY